MFKARTLALFLVIALLTAVLGACQDGKKKESNPSDETGSSGEIVSGGTITVGIAQDLGDSLDPYQMTAAGTREVLFNVYEGLVKPDKDGNFVPAVAAALPEISEDRLTYTFRLRENVKFHNDAVVTPNDVVKSFETCAATTVDTALAAALSAVTSVEATADGAIVIKLSEPNGDLLSYLASVYISPAGYADGGTQPIGTGPFRFVSRSVQDKIVIEKHEGYWGTAAHLDTVTYKIYEDTTALMSALSAGSADMAAHLSIDQVGTLNPDEFQTLEGTMNLVQALYLNHKHAPFDNLKVRQALAHAINVDEILAITAEGHGTKLGSSIYPAFTKYFDESLVDAYPHDVDKAKSLLAEAGYPEGFAMTITVPSNYTPHVNTAEVMVEQLAKAGITAKIQLVEWGSWLSEVYQGRSFESTVVGFDAVSLTAGALLNRWISTDGKNMINYANPAYDAAMKKAEGAADDAERTQLYRDAAKILSDDVANVYTQDLADFVVMKKNLAGYAFYPLYVIDMASIHYVQ